MNFAAVNVNVCKVNCFVAWSSEHRVGPWWPLTCAVVSGTCCRHLSCLCQAVSRWHGSAKACAHWPVLQPSTLSVCVWVFMRDWYTRNPLAFCVLHNDFFQVFIRGSHVIDVGEMLLLSQACGWNKANYRAGSIVMLTGYGYVDTWYLWASYIFH